ncbi:MAG: hypothetical protein WCK70_01650 [Chloroflexales bacterium]
MSTIHIQAQLSSDQLLHALDAMPLVEFEQFAEQILAMRLRRHAAVLSVDESTLLLKINQGLPEAIRQRYAELRAKRDTRSLTDEEYTDLLQITDQVEQREAERMEHVATLAMLRQTTIAQLIDDLGMRPPTDD